MKKLSIFIAIGLVSILCLSRKAVSQDKPFITFEYMHVKPGNDNAYMQVENFWRHIHLAQQKKGIIEGWSVWEVVAPYNMNAPYQYVVLMVYPHFSDYLHAYKDLNMHQIFPNASDDSLKKMFSMTDTARDLIRRDIFSPDGKVGNTASPIPMNYMMVTYDKVSPDNEESFESFMKDHWIPVVHKIVSGGFADFWWYGDRMFGKRAKAPYNYILCVVWNKDNMFDKVPPFGQYRKEDPALAGGYKLVTTDRRELLHRVISLETPAK